MSASELLAMWDVPEPLDMLLSSEAERRDLFRTCLFPLKILERVSEKMRSIRLQDVTATPASVIKTVSHGLSAQTEGGDVLLNVAANAALTSEAVAGTSEVSSVCKVVGPISELEASQALKEVLDKLQDENAKGSDRNAKAAKDGTAKAPTYMWDRWTLPCCALTTRDDKGDLRKLDWKRSFGVLRSVMLRFWKWSLLRGFFRYKSKTEGDSGRKLPTYVQEAAWDCLSREACVWYGPGTEVLVRFFWNWQEEFQEDLIKGMRMWI